MSCDYYLACTTCGSCVHVAQDGLSGWSFYSGEPDCMKTLGVWMGAHTLGPCKVVLLPEQDVEEYEEIEWSPR